MALDPDNSTDGAPDQAFAGAGVTTRAVTGTACFFDTGDAGARSQKGSIELDGAAPSVVQR